MPRIFKYHIPIKAAMVDDTFSIPLPEDARFLHLGLQNDAVYAWYIVDPERQVLDREFFLLSTGHPIDSKVLCDFSYVGTVVGHRDRFVWHLFEKI